MDTSTHNIPTLFPSLNAHISLLTASALILFLLPIASSDYFDFPNFYPTTTDNGVLYQGDAGSLVGAVEFNSLIYLCRVGWATYAERVQLWDSETRALSDFTTNFSFTIDTLKSPHYGHGLAFFLAPVGFQIPPNSAGGFLGLFNTTTSHSVKNQMVVVEFDSYPNLEWDPPYEHGGINNSIGSVITTPWNASLHTGLTCDASITYTASTKNLSLFWSYGGNSSSQGNSSLSYKIDLMEVLPEWVMVGFSAATGAFLEKNTLRSWQFTSSFDTKTTSGSAVLRKRRRVQREKTEKIHLTSIHDDLERGAGPRRFSYGNLATATSNFSAQRKLGEEGFGGVYKGYLNDLDMAELEIGLLEWVWDLYERGPILSAVDERLNSNFDSKDVECLMIVVLWCAYPDHSLRPSIRQAIQVLHFEAPMPNLPKKMPVPMYQVPRAPTSRFEDQVAISSGEPMISYTGIETVVKSSYLVFYRYGCLRHCVIDLYSCSVRLQ
ncbi:hypothetical protein RHSIM_Rhsim10G0176100 [Rhododendron simsii]|uniref:Legume lectin domain-containing protein n=1 Tax=Rhododendron simsii TaxID=118357 RepID=A0A834GBY6_RHOSS|nr:hypothetical protein RHSIM_Rhsim10G0176100 [Rhododendron simsii]